MMGTWVGNRGAKLLRSGPWNVSIEVNLRALGGGEGAYEETVKHRRKLSAQGGLKGGCRN